MQRPPEHELTDELIHEAEYFQCDRLLHVARGEISPYDLNPNDRRLREEEAKVRADPKSYPDFLLDVFETDCAPRPLSSLGLRPREIILGGVTPPRIRATTYDEFIENLDRFSGGLVGDLPSGEGIVIAGGSVFGALVGCEANDIDIYLTRPDTAQGTFDKITAAVHNNQSRRSQGARQRILFTRGKNAVTAFRVCGSRVGKGSPPVQVITALPRCICDLLVNFDVPRDNNK